MNQSSRSIVLIALGLGLVVIAGWFVYTYDVTREFTTRWSEKAQESQFFVLQELAKKRGASIEQKRRYSLPTVEKKTLVVLGGRRSLTAREEEDLMSWVERGGHLVAVPILPHTKTKDGEELPLTVDDDDSETTGEDPLLRRLGVSYIVNPRVDPTGSRGNTEWADVALPDGNIRVTRSLFGNRELIADDDADVTWRVKTGDDDRALRVTYGNGRVTLIPGLRFASNWSITRYDHATFAVAALDLAPGAEVTVVRTYSSAGFFRWLADNALPALIALVVLIVVWGWRHLPRFGPVLTPPLPARQSLVEHIRATGRWMWRAGAHQNLYAASRNAFERRLAIRIPGSSALPKDQQARLLSERTGIDLATAQLALDGSTPPDVGQFVARVRLIETILKKL
jgi:hypothetical protein